MSKVPRRESPWGMPEGDNREPKAHRCNDRAEDVIQACFEGNPFKTVPGPFKLFWQCMRSKPGLPTFGYVIKGVNCNKYSHLEWRHRYSSLSLCNNDKRCCPT
ncbi:hypothetical protein D5086_032137 [Populus alba]|uniref:Uncharacterized protein n=1 Tax=Populus alba TaxID=43335 RepID=A0ACC4ALF8_POPAL